MITDTTKCAELVRIVEDALTTVVASQQMGKALDQMPGALHVVTSVNNLSENSDGLCGVEFDVRDEYTGATQSFRLTLKPVTSDVPIASPA